MNSTARIVVMWLRRVAAAITLVAFTTLFLGLAGTFAKLLCVLAKWEFVPALLAGNLIVAGGIFVMTILVGRLYCGVCCPLGILQDAAFCLAPHKHQAGKAKKLQAIVRYAVLAGALAVGLCGFGYSWLEPYGLFGRGVAAAQLNVPAWAIAVELGLLAIIFALGIWKGRVWCNWICPVGTLLGVCSAVAPLGLKIDPKKCIGCRKCERSCRASAITIAGKGEGGRIDKTKCVQCRDCTVLCPAEAIGVRFSKVESQKSKVESQKSKVESQKSKVESQKSKVESLKSEVESQKAGVESPEAGVESPKPKVESPKAVVESQRHAVGRRTANLEAAIARLEAAQAKNEAGKPKPETAETAKPKPETQNSSDMTRREFIIGSTAVGAALAAKAADEKIFDGGFAEISDPGVDRRNLPLKPAGSHSLKNFTEKCVGCQLCVQMCPNHVLRPSVRLNDFMQPEMAFDKGFCTVDCTRCSQVCPAGAIAPITPEQKLTTHIGEAVWHKDRCLAATEGVNCSACYRHCPTRAISRVPNEDGVLIPVVDTFDCMGCGACEHVCPARPMPAMTVKAFERHREHSKMDETDALQEAISLIEKDGKSCVLIKDGEFVDIKGGRGVSPILEIYDAAPESMKGSFLVDKVIGRAAAAICVAGGIKGVYGITVSADGAAFLAAHNIPCEAANVVPKILNREKNGLCPLEESCQGLDDPAMMIEAIRAKIASFKK